MSYTLIERKELTSAASSISFDNIPQFYSDLVLQVSSRTDGGGPDCIIRPNGSTSNMSGRRLRGNGSNAASSVEGGYLENSISTDTASTFSNGTAYFPNYSGSTFKSFSTDAIRENNATDSRQAMMANLWSDTAPITSLTLVPSASVNFVAGSSFSLYGINRQQAIGAPKAVGGAISFANGYWVHSFTGSGTFYSQQDLDVDALVIAGGGGSANIGGGGGAGGYLLNRNIRLNAGATPVIVGAGGAFSTGANVRGVNGVNSNLLSISAIGGGGGGASSSTTNTTGAIGGSGGGGGNATTSGQHAGGAGTSGQGNAGGFGNYTVNQFIYGGAGGGAGGAGGNSGSSANAAIPQGGAGLESTITGSTVIYARGGNGSADGSPSAAPPVNTGSGGHSSVWNGSAYVGLSNGSSGIVIIRYKA